MLSASEIERFCEGGYVRLEGAFSRETAAGVREFLWEQLALRGVMKEDPSTWSPPVFRMNENFDGPVFRGCKSERLKLAVDDLVGPGRWRTREDDGAWGWWPVNFASGADLPWDVPTRGWHWDGGFFHHTVNAPDQGLLLLCIFSDIDSRGGATLIAEGSHTIVARYLNAHPEGMSLQEGVRECPMTHPWLADLAGIEVGADARYDAGRFASWRDSGDRVDRYMNRSFVDDFGARLRVVEATAKAGDVFLCHPFLVHAASQNHLRVPRFLCNRTTPLRDPLCFDRPAGDYSPVERSIRMALQASGS